MNRAQPITFRNATRNDFVFLCKILVSAAAASGVHIQTEYLSSSESYQYVNEFPKGDDVGIVAETNGGHLVGAAWVRLLSSDAHSVNEHLPELTMGVDPKYQRMGIGTGLMEELYKAVSAIGITKISLGVHRDNTAAIRLYQKQGWIEDGKFNEYIMMSRKMNI